MAQVLRHLVPNEDPRALVDATSGDDAGVYLLDEDRALVVTTDFFTPIVDDPYDFGQIAAANALSDLYAMGARPLFALNLVGFPRKHLDDGSLGEIIRGGMEKAREAGVAVLGGHSIDDPEPKYGMVAIGEVHPDALVTLGNAHPGERLVLTKPLGTGIVTTALKEDAASEEILAHAVATMATLNRGACEAMLDADVSAATDVTGFGLLGHLRNLLRQSGIGARLDTSQLPLIPGVVELVEAGHIPGGTKRNLTDVQDDVEFGPGVSETIRILLCDAQTSGGLLMAVREERLAGLLHGLDGKAPVAAVIGETTEGPPGSIVAE